MTVNMGLTNFVPMISQWKLQEIDDIYDSFDDWDFHTYRCVMKDGKKYSLRVLQMKAMREIVQNISTLKVIINLKTSCFGVKYLLPRK